MDKILTKFSASELARLIATKEVSPVDVMRGYLDRIETVSYTHLTLPTILLV